MNKQREIKKLYELCNIDYDKHMTKTGHYKAQEKISKKLKSYIKEPIIDLACGAGFLISVLLRDYSDVAGNDFSRKMVKIAGENLNLKITSDNAVTLKSYRKKFKTIICCNLFFYLQDRDKAISRWAKLLDKKGRIIILEEYPFISPKSKEMDKYKARLLGLVDPISPIKIIKIVVKNGFTLDKKISVKIDNRHKLFGLVFSKESF